MQRHFLEKYSIRNVIFCTFIKLNERTMELMLSNAGTRQNAKTFRIISISGFLFFASFGAIDYFLLPDNYVTAWAIRFLILGISFAIPYILSYYSWFAKYIKTTSIALMAIAQICLFAIIFISNKQETAYYDYSYGLSLIILWSAFIFRIKTKILIVCSAATIILFNYLAIYHQSSLSNGIHSIEFAHFLNINMILITSNVLSITGNSLLGRFSRKVQKEKQLLNEALTKAKEGEQIKTNFLNTMSHEIRTPLNGIIGFSNILISEPQNSDVKEFAETINRQAYQLLNVLTSMLEFSELNTEKDLGEKSKTSIEHLIKFLKKRFNAIQENLGKNNISFIVDIDASYHSMFIWTYLDRLQYILLAIIENAVKFSEKGKIKLNMRMINNTDIIFSISDEGIGIENNRDSEIFSNFSQLDASHNRKYDGIGMGLSISRRIITLMGGEIWYQMNKDRGTTFYISVPKVLKRI